MSDFTRQLLRVSALVIGVRVLTVLVIGATVLIQGDVSVTPATYLAAELTLVALIRTYSARRRYSLASVGTGVFVAGALSTAATIIRAPQIDDMASGMWWRCVLSGLIGAAAAVSGYLITVAATRRRQE
jgi:hypothetical protein